MEKLFIAYWCQVAAEATMAGKAQSGTGDLLSSTVLPASDRGAVVPRRAPATPQDWLCWL